MRNSRIVASVGLVAALTLALPPLASAQGRQGQSRGRSSGSRDSGRAVPRPSVRPGPPVRVAPNHNYYYRGYPSYRAYRPTVNLGFFYGYPGYYGVYGYPGYYGAYGYAPYRYGYAPYGWVAPYGYGYSGYAGRPYGGVRIDLPQRNAEVFVDGYFVGTVDDFDGTFQQANVEAGPHRIEVKDPEFETITFDVNVEPGRTVTYRASMRPLHP